MAKEMDNFDRSQKGLSAMPDPQASMNRASGAWEPPARQAPAMEAPAGPVAGRTFYMDRGAPAGPAQ